MKAKTKKKYKQKGVHKHTHVQIELYATNFQDCKDLRCAKNGDCPNVQNILFFKKIVLRPCLKYVFDTSMEKK